MTNLLLFFVLCFSAFGFSELIIAVPASTHAQQQTFEASYIKKPTPVRISEQDTLAEILRSQNLGKESATQTPTDTKSFSMIQNAASNIVGIQKSEDGQGMTITIKLDGLNGIQGQGSSVQNSYSQPPEFSNQVQQGYSFSEVLSNSGLRIPNPFKFGSTLSSPHYSVNEVPLTESNSFLKSVRNLIQSQFATFMDSKPPSYSYPKTLGNPEIPYEKYAIFTPIATQPAKPPQYRQNVADFLIPKYEPTTPQSGQNNPKVQIAMPQTTLLTAASDPTGSAFETSDKESPLYSAANAVVRTVSQIPTNLDLMFNDMGRMYRQNLFSLRNKISDMSSYVPGTGSTSKPREITEPWLDGFGA